MKTLAAILVLVLLSFGAYHLVKKGDVVNRPRGGGSSTHDDQGSDKALDIPFPDFEEDTLPADESRAKSLAEVDRSSWAKYRNALEQQVPDPDGIGPCPPPHMGGWPALVVRRFLDHESGDRIWLHEDGSKTWEHYQRTKDPGAKKAIDRWIISTAVPTPTGVSDPGSFR
jgi:hypothetical protein